MEVPEFTAPIGNVTTPLGKEALLACTVDHMNIAKYKVTSSLCLTRPLTPSLSSPAIVAFVITYLFGEKCFPFTRHYRRRRSVTTLCL